MYDTAHHVLFTVCALLLYIVADRHQHLLGQTLTKLAASSGFIAIALSLLVAC